jgi:transposase
MTASTPGKPRRRRQVPVLRLIKRSDDIKGLVIRPRPWVAERTFSWFGRNRRLAKDFENLARTLAAFLTSASPACALVACQGAGPDLNNRRSWRRRSRCGR